MIEPMDVPDGEALNVKVCDSYFGVQLSPSWFVSEGHIALSARLLIFCDLVVGEEVFVRRLCERDSRGLIVDEIGLRDLNAVVEESGDGVVNSPRVVTPRVVTPFVPGDSLCAEEGYALVSRCSFGMGRNKYLPFEQVMLYKHPFSSALAEG
jgi:hypothetical protein